MHLQRCIYARPIVQMGSGSYIESVQKYRPRVQWRARLAARMPELAFALFVPGGSLLPLATWAFRHRAWLIAQTRRALTAMLEAAVGVRRGR